MQQPFPTTRSRSSLDFEAFWRALPMQGYAPHRREFKPEKATRFLKNLMLIEAPVEAASRLRIRLTGSAIQLRIQRDVTGSDYLEFLPPAYQAGALESARLMIGRPCGLWQRMAVHYERGFAQMMEITGFPLLADPGGVPLLLGFMEPVEKAVAPAPALGRAMTIDTAAAFEFLDLGAGVPAWPQAA